MRRGTRPVGRGRRYSSAGDRRFPRSTQTIRPVPECPVARSGEPRPGLQRCGVGVDRPCSLGRCRAPHANRSRLTSPRRTQPQEQRSRSASVGHVARAIRLGSCVCRTYEYLERSKKSSTEQPARRPNLVPARRTAVFASHVTRCAGRSRPQCARQGDQWVLRPCGPCGLTRASSRCHDAPTRKCGDVCARP